MPTYDYVCDACGHALEAFHAMSAPPLRTCPKCGKKKLVRKIGAGAGVIFKGSGFYQTDYKSPSRGTEAKSEGDGAGASEKGGASEGTGPGGAKKAAGDGSGRDKPAGKPSSGGKGKGRGGKESA
jgi:putative FmdB family regulatory protein